MSNPSDPKSADDCLRHCRHLLSDLEYQRAVTLIEKYAETNYTTGLNDCLAIYNKVLNAPIRPEEVRR